MPEPIEDDEQVTPESDSGGDGDPKKNDKPAEKPKFEPITIESQEALNALFAKRVDRERKKYEGFDDFKAKAEKFDALEAEQGTVVEKATRRAEKAERERDEFKAKVAAAERLDLVRDIAGELGLPNKLISRVKGDGEDAIRADITDLMDGLPSTSVDDSEKDKDKDGPPSRAPKAKMRFTTTGDDAGGVELSADDILKGIPRGGAV